MIKQEKDINPRTFITSEIYFTKEKVELYKPKVDPNLLQNKDLVLKAGNLYKFKADPNIVLSLNLYKERQFINKHYNEFYLKRIDKLSSIKDSIEKVFKGHIMFSGEIVKKQFRDYCNLTSTSTTECKGKYIGFLVDKQVFFLEEKTFWEQGLVELETGPASAAK